jgi:outer membrane protein OmpA-like peptidoglycan-associated protein
LGLFLAAPGVVLADGSNNNHALPYLRMGVGTRALGMGGAHVAAGNDATVGYWNPAGLTWATGTQISAMYALGMSDDRGMSFVAGSHQFGWGALGASFISAGMKDIEGYDAGDNPTGTFDYGDLAVMLHGAYATEYVSLGATAKYLHQGLDADVPGDDGVNGFGFDVGATMRPWEWMRLGVALRDLVTKIGSDEEADDVPLNLRLGTAIMPLDGLCFAFDLDHVQHDAIRFHVGTEYGFPVSEDIRTALRLGLNDGDITAGLGVGVGVGVRFLEFNYAFVEEPQDFMGESHRIGVTLKFGEQEQAFDYAPRGRDKDLDGIPDSEDACPGAAEDFDGFEDSDGCPDVDNDGDGILDINDDCPNRAEDFDGFNDEDGCPDRDNDGDGIPDAEDKCPNAAETLNKFQDEDGCPDKAPLQVGLIYVNFTFGTAEFTGTDAIQQLDKVADVMKTNPEMEVKIIGHTDSVGADKYNMDLSLKRAKAIKGYLVKKGVAGERLMTEGRGKKTPIATNDTEEGRARNRRIELTVIR